MKRRSLEGGPVPGGAAGLGPSLIRDQTKEKRERNGFQIRSTIIVSTVANTPIHAPFAVSHWVTDLKESGVSVMTAMNSEAVRQPRQVRQCLLHTQPRDNQIAQDFQANPVGGRSEQSNDGDYFTFLYCGLGPGCPVGSALCT
jgi:hypothetical protein